jgi:large subunit ribosomal protein L29
MKVREQMGDFRGLTVQDLQQRARSLEEQVFRLRLQSSMGQVGAGNKIRPLRRELARVKTVISEKGGRD